MSMEETGITSARFANSDRLSRGLIFFEEDTVFRSQVNDFFQSGLLSVNFQLDHFFFVELIESQDFSLRIYRCHPSYLELVARNFVFTADEERQMFLAYKGAPYFIKFAALDGRAANTRTARQRRSQAGRADSL